MEVTVTSREFQGREWLYQVSLGSLRLSVRQPLSSSFALGERCGLTLAAEAEPLVFPSRALITPRPAAMAHSP